MGFTDGVGVDRSRDANIGVRMSCPALGVAVITELLSTEHTEINKNRY